MQNYDLLVERIAKSADLEKEEVERRVEAKKAKLSGLISREGAAQIIAAELGINFEDQDLKVSELMAEMRKVNVVGKIINLFPVREYSKNGREGKVANFVLADETGSVRVVLWDINHIELIENETIKQGDVVKIKSGSTRNGEIHLSGFGELTKSDAVMNEVRSEAIVSEKSLDEVQQGQSIRVRGVVVQIFQPRFYSVCPECNKKVTKSVVGSGESVVGSRRSAVGGGESAVGEQGKGEQEVKQEFRCAEHGVISPKDKAILSFVLDDGTETMRVVMFSDQVNILIPEEDLKDAEKATAFRDDFIGTEIYLSGNVKRNQLFNNLEVVASNVEKVDVEKLIQTLDA